MRPVRIAVAIVRRGDEFLVGRRQRGSELAGLWEFPGGKIEPEETDEQAAVRECREETDLVVQVINCHSVQTHRYEHREVELHFFECCPLDPTAAPRPPFRWVHGRELQRYRFPAGNHRLLESLRAEFAGGENNQ